MPFPHGFDPLPTQTVPLCTTMRYLFLAIDPRNFQKALLAPVYTNFEGEHAPKKTAFLVKSFQKVPKTPFLACFFKILPAAQNFGRNRVFLVFWELWKINLGDLKKVDKIFEQK